MLISLSLPIQAQSIVACQFTNSDGYRWSNGKWSNAKFKLEKPFFMKINQDGIIELDSINNLIIGATECKRVWRHIKPENVMCIGSMDFVSFNTKTMEGATSYIGGATQEGDRDTISTALFTCQKM